MRNRASRSRSAGDPFEALGDPSRREILTLLGSGPRSVGEIADELPISRPAVSWHLRLLRDAGLVSSEERGTRRIYALQDGGVEAVRQYLEELWGDVSTRYRLVADNQTKSRRRRP
jgi:DNA-binding transcriptional ArsR family regulator